MEIAVNEEMKRSHFLIDCMVLATIFLMCTITFHSMVAGLMLIVPLILANLMAFQLHVHHGYRSVHQYTAGSGCGCGYRC